MEEHKQNERGTRQSYNDAEYDIKKRACVVCHSKDGNSPQYPDYPVLAGQDKAFLVRALKDYGSGSRRNAMMQEQVKVLDLSDTDIDRMANHYASERGLVRVSAEKAREAEEATE